MVMLEMLLVMMMVMGMLMTVREMIITPSITSGGVLVAAVSRKHQERDGLYSSIPLFLLTRKILCAPGSSCCLLFRNYLKRTYVGKKTNWLTRKSPPKACAQKLGRKQRGGQVYMVRSKLWKEEDGRGVLLQALPFGAW